MSHMTNSGEHLAEGFVLVSQVRSEDNSTPTRIVLHNSLKDGEFVCHCQDMANGGCYWGHYGTFEEALASYLRRVSDLGVSTDMINSPAFATGRLHKLENLRVLIRAARTLVDSCGSLADAASECSDDAENLKCLLEEETGD